MYIRSGLRSNDGLDLQLVSECLRSPIVAWIITSTDISFRSGFLMAGTHSDQPVLNEIDCRLPIVDHTSNSDLPTPFQTTMVNHFSNGKTSNVPSYILSSLP